MSIFKRIVSTICNVFASKEVCVNHYDEWEEYAPRCKVCGDVTEYGTEVCYVCEGDAQPCPYCGDPSGPCDMCYSDIMGH